MSLVTSTPTKKFQRDATMANVPPLARAVLVLMGFNVMILW
ncbi:MAG TPA: hypothetical protein VE344_03320 [Methylomirabilota bacterium]|nr:hypothetical protein [Methylomirabilota bacterium]